MTPAHTGRPASCAGRSALPASRQALEVLLDKIHDTTSNAEFLGQIHRQRAA